MFSFVVGETRIPSVNERTLPIKLKSGRVMDVPSPYYRKWHIAMTAAFKDAFGPRKKIVGKVSVSIEVETCKDIDNVIKPILDCLQSAEIIENDRHIVELAVRKTSGKRGRDNFRVRVTEAKNDAKEAD